MRSIFWGQGFLWGWLALATFACAGVRFPWTASNSTMTQSKELAVQTLNQRYDRIHSRVFIRRITRPTLANLDFAAYEANMMLYQPRETVAGLANSPDLRQVFGGHLQAIVAGIEQTPLSVAERGKPMAFSPMVDYLARRNSAWASGLEDVRAAVRTESWGLAPNIQYTYQQVSTAWIHVEQNQKPEIWVRVEFAPWARLFSNMPDQNQDGFPEIYARIRPDLVPDKAIEQLTNDYLVRELNKTDVTTWINELASYWYPSFNTDVVAADGCQPWPDEAVEQEVTFELSRLNNDLSFVIRGKPQGVVLYNVFVVDGMPRVCKHEQGQTNSTRSGAPGKVHVQTGELIKKIKQEVSQLGSGSFSSWNQKLAVYHRDIRRILRNRPKEIKAFMGKDGFLFFRASLRYILSGDLQKQAAEKNPLATIVSFKEYLASMGVDFLVVPVPSKSEVYPDKLLELEEQVYPMLNPYARKFFLELSRASVEVIDLLPIYLKERKSKEKAEQQLYQAQDTHWTDRGLRIAARVLAERVKRYGWYRDGGSSQLDTKLKPVHLSKYGDLHSRLTDKEQINLKPQKLRAHQVQTRDKKPLQDDPTSPIVVLGDSFTGVFQRIDCRHAGLSAHLAHLLRQPIDLVMSWGGGPNVRNKLLRRSAAAVAKKKLVIWVFAARDLYDYWEPWEPIKKGK